MVWLSQGNYEQGWTEFEWRWRCKGFALRPFTQPAWDGSSLADKAILLHTEQGAGDTIQFVRYSPLVKERGARVILECPARLIPLLKSCRGIDAWVAQGALLPAFDVHLPLLSLPRIFGTTVTTVPTGVPYLAADSQRVERWRRELAPLHAFKVGIVWQGNPEYLADYRRSPPLALYGLLARVPGVQLFSLQKGDGIEQFADITGEFLVTDLGGRSDVVGGAFVDTAAIMPNLDLVITSDTATAHLAGALGVTTWVPLSYAADWRWLLDREDCPWYPTMRLFRQAELGNWKPVFERVARELDELAASHCAKRIGMARRVADGTCYSI
jgi:hypothetical protein